MNAESEVFALWAGMSQTWGPVFLVVAIFVLMFARPLNKLIIVGCALMSAASVVTLYHTIFAFRTISAQMTGADSFAIDPHLVTRIYVVLFLVGLVLLVLGLIRSAKSVD